MKKLQSPAGVMLHSGFTLIELMIAVAVIGILAGIAYPSYTQYIVRSNRAAAEGYMMGLTNQQQQFMLDARQYFCTPDDSCAQTKDINLPAEVAKNYDVTIDAEDDDTPPTYTITATPIGAQAERDTKCGALTLNQAGTKGEGGTGTVADCW